MSVAFPFFKQNQQTSLLPLLQYWRNIEFLRAFDFDEVIESRSQCFLIFEHSRQPFPWEEPALYDLDPEYAYGYDLFLFPFPKNELLRVLGEKFPNMVNELSEDQPEMKGLTCLARFSLSGQGFVDFDSCGVSTYPWALKTLAAGGELSLASFSLFSDQFLQQAISILKHPTEENAIIPFSHQTLDTLAAYCEKELAPVSRQQTTLLGAVTIYRLFKKKELEEKPPDTKKLQEELRKKRTVDILNSFYLRDLDRLYSSFQQKEESLAHRLLSRALNPDENRCDLLRPENFAYLQKKIAVKVFPRGRWVAAPAFAQTVQQQFAINHYLEKKDPLQGVNGPPGTGKTTLLRDLFADIIVQRAFRLAKLAKPEDIFEDGMLKLKSGGLCRKLRPEFAGYEMVVASSNNAAVENITAELPSLKAVAPEFAHIVYLKDVATRYVAVRAKRQQGLVSEERWGMPSVALGNARNRAAFSFALFDEEKKDRPEATAKESEEQILAESIGSLPGSTLFQWRQTAQAGNVSFWRAKSEFLALHAKVTNLLDEQSLIISGKDQDLALPVELQTARSQLLIAAFTLQESFLREVPKIENEFRQLRKMLRTPGSLSAEESLVLWQLLFLIVPVVSTTLASVERMFAKLGPKALGHVFIDEAGQANPQSVLGILWRAQNALVIGDQRQLKPITLLPSSVEKSFYKTLSPEIRAAVSISDTSAQFFVDQGSRVGTLLSGEQPIWVSTPLIVHRRCAEPMFSLANDIAYGGLMRSVVPQPPPHPILSDSAWYQCSGAATNKQWVPEQATLLWQLVSQLFTQSQEEDFFVISPFREVATRAREYLQRKCREQKIDNSFLQKRIGTIHTFQGKEADLVFLLLGCDEKTSAAADWAGKEPHLLNVALTRAKRYIYVIGDMHVWHNRGYFSELEKRLVKRSSAIVAKV